jgi:hypothetical protein
MFYMQKIPHWSHIQQAEHDELEIFTVLRGVLAAEERATNAQVRVMEAQAEADGTAAALQSLKRSLGVLVQDGD